MLDDLLWIRAGEQVPADGQIIQTWGLELDESMLTGESRTVRHKVGEQVYSGATAVSGMALVKVNAVGSHSYAATLTAQAKVYKKTVSDLNKGINTILKFMTFLVVPLCILLILSQIHTVGGWGTALSTGRMAASRGFRGRRRSRHDSRRLGAADFAELRGGRHASRPSQYAGAGA